MADGLGKQDDKGAQLAASAGVLIAAIVAAAPALAQKQGGILQMPGFASPASMSIQKSTIAAGIR